MSASNKPYVLVIEPSSMLCRAVQACCESKHISVKTADSVIESLQQVLQERPAGVIMSLSLEGFSGYSFLGAMQADTTYRDVPIAVFTSQQSVTFDDSVFKPDHVVHKGPELESDVGAFLALLGLLEEEEKAEPVKVLENIRILLAEDSELIQHALGVVLRSAGAQVSIANQGAEALDLASKNDFDLILMDIEMPVLNGVEAAGILRTRGYDGPILALTAHEQAETRARYDVQSFDEVMQKPKRLKDLVHDCASFLKEHAGQAMQAA